MSNDALERLKQRQRPTVPTRDTSLTPSKLDTPIPSHVDTSVPRNLEEPEQSFDQPIDTKISRSLEFNEPQNLVELQIKQSTLRLEAQLSDRLSTVCRENNISREVLLEALFLHYESDPEAWKVILDEAKKRGEYRQQLANFRRAQSMMQKFGERT